MTISTLLHLAPASRNSGGRPSPRSRFTPWSRGASAVSRPIELEDGASWSRPTTRSGMTLRCERGVLWVTVEGDPEDHVLRAPQTFGTPSRGRVAAVAFGPARFSTLES